VLREAVAEAQKDPAVIERFTVMGMLVPTATRAEFAASIKAEAELWSRTIAQGKITLE
jgi:tripartite-type tricarboxylate transporter receptor subunit TctC